MLVARRTVDDFRPYGSAAWVAKYKAAPTGTPLDGVYPRCGWMVTHKMAPNDYVVQLHARAMQAMLPLASMRCVPFPFGSEAIRGAIAQIEERDPRRAEREIWRYNVAPIVVYTPPLWALLTTTAAECCDAVVPAQHLLIGYRTMLQLLISHSFSPLTAPPSPDLPQWVTEPNLAVAFRAYQAFRRFFADKARAGTDTMRPLIDALGAVDPQISDLYALATTAHAPAQADAPEAQAEADGTPEADAPMAEADVTPAAEADAASLKDEDELGDGITVLEFRTMRYDAEKNTRKLNERHQKVMASRAAMDAHWQRQTDELCDQYDALFCEQLHHFLDGGDVGDPVRLAEFTVDTLNNLEAMLATLIQLPAEQHRAVQTSKLTPPAEHIPPHVQTGCDQLAARAVDAAIKQRSEASVADEMWLLPPALGDVGHNAFMAVLVQKLHCMKALRAAGRQGHAPEAGVDLVGGQPAGDAHA